MRRMLLLAALVSLVVTAGCSGRQGEPVRVPRTDPLEAPSRVETAVANAALEYSGTLMSLNRSSVRGSVHIDVDGDRIEARASFRGMSPGEEYVMAIHGFEDGRLSSGPPEGTRITGEELEKRTGPLLVELAPFSGQGEATKITRRLDASGAYPLDIRAVVVWRETAPGAGQAVPVAYALLRGAEIGDDGVGGPGGTPQGAVTQPGTPRPGESQPDATQRAAESGAQPGLDSGQPGAQQSTAMQGDSTQGVPQGNTPAGSGGSGTIGP